MIGRITTKRQKLSRTHPLNPLLLLTGDEVLTVVELSFTATAAAAAAAVSVIEINTVRSNQSVMNNGSRCTFAKSISRTPLLICSGDVCVGTIIGIWQNCKVDRVS